MTFPYADEIAEYTRGVERARRAYAGLQVCPGCGNHHRCNQITCDACRAQAYRDRKKEGA